MSAEPLGPFAAVLVLWAIGVAACTASERVDLGRDGAVTSTGEGGSGAGTAGPGAGSSGAAGVTAGSAGTAGATSSGKAGTTGASGTAGSAGTGAVSAGTGGTGAAGTGTGGTAGKVDGGAGTGGVTDAATDGPLLTYSGPSGIENVLVQNCGGCHYAAPGVNIQGGFSFSYANVTGVVTSGNKNCPSLDASKRRAVPGHPESSLIYIKANVGTPPAGCGGHMPFSGGQLGPLPLTAIRGWILQGCKP